MRKVNVNNPEARGNEFLLRDGLEGRRSHMSGWCTSSQLTALRMDPFIMPRETTRRGAVRTSQQTSMTYLRAQRPTWQMHRRPRCRIGIYRQVTKGRQPTFPSLERWENSCSIWVTSENAWRLRRTQPTRRRCLRTWRLSTQVVRKALVSNRVPLLWTGFVRDSFHVNERHHRTSPNCVAPGITFLATNPITFLHRFNTIIVLSSKIHNRHLWSELAVTVTLSSTLVRMS